MKIGTIGAGEVAQAFARKAIDAGHEITFSNNRGPSHLNGLLEKFGPNASAATRETAAALPIVLLAVPWPKVASALQGLPDWEDRILIDATNGFDENGGLADIGDDSTSEIVARLATGARVVKAMNQTFMKNFKKDPEIGNFRKALFISGDHPGATAKVADLFEGFGFAPVLLGSLHVGGRMQAVGGTLAGHDLYLPWPAPRAFPAFNGQKLMADA